MNQIMSNSMWHRGAILAVLCLVTFAGCQRGLREPDLGGLYDRAAMHHDENRNPIIVIPGILGSKLMDGPSKRVVWGAFADDYANPQRPDGARLLALPMREGADLAALTDDVVPDGALDRVRVSLFGLPLELNAYINILATLGVGGYRDQQLGEAGAINYGEDHYTCFQFAYDWRRDLTENARQLHAFIEERRRYVQAERQERYGVADSDVKFDIIAHSMGGLLTRYYLRYGTNDPPAAPDDPSVPWAGAEYVERVILVGTPNAGSVKALHQLVRGAEFAAILPKVEPAVIGTMPAVYQLMPRGRHDAVLDASTGEPIQNLFDPDLWEKMRWGLADPKQERVLEWLLPEISNPAERRRIALEHQAKCLRRAERFMAALDVPAQPPEHVSLYLFAGDAVSTPAVLRVDPKKGTLDVTGWAPGDGTVIRSSALMDERKGNPWVPSLRSPIEWRQVQFLFTNHLGITKDPAFADNVLFILLESPRENIRQ